MLRFVQIVAEDGRLFGLDSDGQVWEYESQYVSDPEPSGWRKLAQEERK